MLHLWGDHFVGSSLCKEKPRVVKRKGKAGSVKEHSLPLDAQHSRKKRQSNCVGTSGEGDTVTEMNGQSVCSNLENNDALAALLMEINELKQLVITLQVQINHFYKTKNSVSKNHVAPPRSSVEKVVVTASTLCLARMLKLE